MKLRFSKRTSALGLATSLVLTFAYLHDAFGFRYAYKETAVPVPIQMSSRLQRLFNKTKLVCFGRYALEVPLEAYLNYGRVGGISVFEDAPDDMEEIAAVALERVKREDRSMEVVYRGKGPVPDSWQLRYFQDKYSKDDGDVMYETYVHKGKHIFSKRDIVQDGEHGDARVAERQRAFATHLRLRGETDAPREPGICLPYAFLPKTDYAEQEMDNAGLVIPGLPDISFSISSNKNAYADYNQDEYEKVWRTKLSLINRINEAKRDQPFSYPSHTLLRQGKRDVHHWHGEESLIKRKDGSHDFEWALVGTPRDVANPSEFNVKMYSGVAHNVVGAAKAVSLSDDEAVALFDKLITGLKFRVQVPGAPAGSYYFPVGAVTAPTNDQ